MEKYLVQRQDHGKKPTTLKHDLYAIKMFLNWCIYNNYLSYNPLNKVETPRIEKKSPRFLTKKQGTMLIENANGDLKRMIAISLHAGIRKSELLRLKWEDFNWGEKLLTIHKSKSGKFRTIPFTDRLKALLAPCRKDYGKVFSQSNILRRQFRKLTNNLGFNIRWHDLRHTYASNLVMDGVPIPTVSQLLGHADISTTMIYSHLSDKHKTEAVKTVNY